ncbi:VOC family protein [Maribacter confluentis]|uniref:VOC family protein n=1 Tax=Maribacter confluentis TaxID=1656093 RepID=A0ABT8RUT8_9FLAO|nr:VOC family protein [Maribacter confluentis]MDO1514706.1 VOC family protein [Maribacter confluentis]
MKKAILLGAVLFTFWVIDCNAQDKTMNTHTTENKSDMKSFISIFEIPATDITRAVNFYQAILDIEIEKMEFPEMQMGIFPYENQMVTGVIMKAEGYTPSANGITIYLNGGDNLQSILDKVEINGGEIMVPKSLHADESGYYAIFLDSEGNKMGLHSPN